ncbi:MAG: rod shape-determining protein RodA [Pseudomonadota bacterium]
MAIRSDFGDRELSLSLKEKIVQINWSLVLLLTMVAGIGVAMLYSAADGNLDPWAIRQVTRFGLGLGVLFIAALIDIRIWLRVAYPFYAISIVLLVAVELFGAVGMGAQRWIDIGFMQLQPSEVMKVAVVLALARYYHSMADEDVGRITPLIIPLVMILAPVALVLRQPDLGTALLLLMVGGAMLFLAGVRLWKFAVVGAAAVSAVPIAFQFLHPYQRNRVLTFFNPENDPLGSGYHILQSKIALGSGGMFGKGFLQGSQAHLNFLPEKQTDFIFTMLAEEFGLAGGLGLIVLYMLITAYGIVIGLVSRNQFGRLVAIGLMTNFFFYVFINIAMVMGMIPVVGVPLPLISYGGTAMLTLLLGFGIVMSVYIHREIRIPRRYPHHTP